MWYRGALIVVTADAELRDAWLSEVHAAKVAGNFVCARRVMLCVDSTGGPHDMVMLRGTSRSVTLNNKSSTHTPDGLLQPL